MIGTTMTRINRSTAAVRRLSLWLLVAGSLAIGAAGQAGAQSYGQLLRDYDKARAEVKKCEELLGDREEKIAFWEENPPGSPLPGYRPFKAETKRLRACLDKAKKTLAEAKKQLPTGPTIAVGGGGAKAGGGRAGGNGSPLTKPQHSKLKTGFADLEKQLERTSNALKAQGRRVDKLDPNKRR